MDNRDGRQVSDQDQSYVCKTIDEVGRFTNVGVSPKAMLLTSSSSNVGPLIDLPIDTEIPQEPLTTRLTTSGVVAATKPQTRLGPFCRAAEATHLLGKVQYLIAQSAWNHQIDGEEAYNLNEALQKLALSLMHLALHGWEECCAAIGLCFRLQFLSLLFPNATNLAQQCHYYSPLTDHGAILRRRWARKSASSSGDDAQVNDSNDD